MFDFKVWLNNKSQREKEKKEYFDILLKQMNKYFQPERSKREDSGYGIKAEVDENGILTMENGDKFNIRDAVL